MNLVERYEKLRADAAEHLRQAAECAEKAMEAPAAEQAALVVKAQGHALQAALAAAAANKMFAVAQTLHASGKLERWLATADAQEETAEQSFAG